MGLNADGRTEEAYAPQKPANHHDEDDHDHGEENMIHNGVLIKGNHLPVNIDGIAVYAVDYDAVKLRHLKLKNVNQNKGQKPKKK